MVCRVAGSLFERSLAQTDGSRSVREFFFFKQKTAYEILNVTGVQTCALPIDRKSTRLNSSHIQKSRMPSSACDWSSDVCSSDRSEEHTSELQSHSESRMPSSA